MSRLTRGGLQSFVEGGEPRFPIITTMPDQVKIGSDNPDSLYMSTSIDGRTHYRVTGHRGTVHYLSISAFAGNYGAGQDRLGLMGFIDGGDLLLDESGRFEIHVGPTQQGEPWIETKPEPAMLAVRQFFLDRESETSAEFEIECLDHDDLPAPLTPEKFGKALQGRPCSWPGVRRCSPIGSMISPRTLATA